MYPCGASFLCYVKYNSKGYEIDSIFIDFGLNANVFHCLWW